MNEIYGRGTHYDFGARYYDARVGKWFTRDLYEKSYPSMSTYSSFGNNPIYNVDINGERLYVSGSNFNNYQTAQLDMFTHAGENGRKLFSVKTNTQNSGEVVTSIFCRNIAILYNDPGVLNLYDMIRAREKMEYRVAEEAIPGGMNYPNGATYNSADKMLKDAEQDPNKFRLINSSTSHGISNLSKTRFNSKDPYEIPSNGFDGQVTILPDHYQYKTKTNSPKSRASVVFHEMLEMFNRTVLKQEYYGLGGSSGNFGKNSAHRNAINVERGLNINDLRRDVGGEGSGSSSSPEAKSKSNESSGGSSGGPVQIVIGEKTETYGGK